MFLCPSLVSLITLSLHDALPILEIQFSNGSESSLTHQGEYSVTPDLARLQTTLLSFVSQTRELTLESPFEARFQEGVVQRSEEHTSELQSRGHLVCRLLLEIKKS